MRTQINQQRNIFRVSYSPFLLVRLHYDIACRWPGIGVIAIIKGCLSPSYRGAHLISGRREEERAEHQFYLGSATHASCRPPFDPSER